MGAHVYLQDLELIAPGLPDWSSAREVLQQQREYQSAPLAPLKPTLLPPNERRRTSGLIKLALSVAEPLLQRNPLEPSRLASVFSSSEGDTRIVERICQALVQPGKPVSPTLFHNSVHNAPAGYWAIAAGATAFSTSIAAAESSFGAGLLEACAFVSLQRQPLLLLCYDESLAESFEGRSVVEQPMALAMLLSPEPQRAIARLEVRPSSEPCTEPQAGVPQPLHPLSLANPAGRALPLLAALARGESGCIVLDYPLMGSLRVELTAC